MKVKDLIDYLNTLPLDKVVDKELIKDIEKIKDTETITCDICQKIIKAKGCALESHKFYKHGIKNEDRKWV